MAPYEPPGKSTEYIPRYIGKSVNLDRRTRRALERKLKPKYRKK